jgi:hypothetical protein
VIYFSWAIPPPKADPDDSLEKDLEVGMKNRRVIEKQIIGKLRGVKVLQSTERGRRSQLKDGQITNIPWYHWRKEYGGWGRANL